MTRDGWTFSFKKGKLHLLSASNGESFLWQKHKDGFAILSQEGPLFTVKEKKEGERTIVTFSFNGKTIRAVKEPAARYEGLFKDRILNKKASILTRIRGKKDRVLEQYSYAVPEKGKASFQIKKNQSPVDTYIWEKSSNLVTKGLDWQYRIQPIKGDYPKIFRTNSKGETEFYHNQSKEGIYTTVEPDGTATKTHRFTITGPIFDKTRVIEEIRGGRLTETSYREGSEKTDIFNVSYNLRALVTYV